MFTIGNLVHQKTWVGEVHWIVSTSPISCQKALWSHWTSSRVRFFWVVPEVDPGSRVLIGFCERRGRCLICIVKGGSERWDSGATRRWRWKRPSEEYCTSHWTRAHWWRNVENAFSGLPLYQKRTLLISGSCGICRSDPVCCVQPFANFDARL